MSSTKSRTEAALLEARDGRELGLRRALAHLDGGPGAVVMVSANIPGARKHRPGLARLTHGALAALGEGLGLEVLHSGFDQLGPFHFGWTRLGAEDVKRAAVDLEAREPSGRILDLDVYRADGTQVDRAALGLPPRTCLLCPEPAQSCIRLRRHREADLVARADALLHACAKPPLRLRPDRLAAALHEGALRELALTPKPGLVDRHDHGSHPDLSLDAMTESADLLPRYYEELLLCAGQGRPLADSVRAGQDAEDRMFRAIRSNGHKGYIFLSGLVLMAACESRSELPLLRPAIAGLASRFFGQAPEAPGARLRAALGLGGIQAETERGLPAVFEHGWPRYREALDAGWEPARAAFLLMAVLMRTVEDTTAARRCGLAGLARLREDGERLERLLEEGEAPEPFLDALNDDYRRLNLTMGGVADCMALTFALQTAAV